MDYWTRINGIFENTKVIFQCQKLLTGTSISSSLRNFFFFFKHLFPLILVTVYEFAEHNFFFPAPNDVLTNHYILYV